MYLCNPRPCLRQPLGMYLCNPGQCPPPLASLPDVVTIADWLLAKADPPQAFGQLILRREVGWSESLPPFRNPQDHCLGSRSSETALPSNGAPDLGFMQLL